MSKRHKRDLRKGRSGKSFALKMDKNEDVDTAEETDNSLDDDDLAQTFSFTNKGQDYYYNVTVLLSAQL